MKKSIVIALCAVALSLVLSYFSSVLIAAWFPNRPVVDDLFFHITPFIPALSFVADAMVVFALVAAVIIIVKYPENAVRVLYSLAIMWTIRAIVNVFTPLGDPSGEAAYGFLETAPLNGMFPSGHTATITVILTWVVSLKEKRFVPLLAGFLVVEIVALLCTRGHYSIDILGGLVLGYYAVVLSQKYIKLR